ncbi:hypothetical protein C1646_822819, partial [Rhizophagus diaphanus]
FRSSLSLSRSPSFSTFFSYLFSAFLDSFILFLFVLPLPFRFSLSLSFSPSFSTFNFPHTFFPPFFLGSTVSFISKLTYFFLI